MRVWSTTHSESWGWDRWSLLFTSKATIIGMVAYLLPYMVLVLYAAMASVDPSLMTAARTMGATGWQAFFHIYVPQVRSAVISGATLIFVLGLSFYLTPAILGGPRNVTLAVYIQQKISIYDWGVASAAGIALTVISLVGYAIAIRIGGASVLKFSGGPVGRGAVEREPLRASPGTAFAWVLVAIALLILLLPIVIIFPASFGTTDQIAFPPQGFTTQWYSDVLRDPLWVNAFYKSLRVALGTGVLAVVVALGLARVGLRARGTWARTSIQALAFAPLVVPAILLGIGMFDVQIKLGLVGTEWGLIMAHTVLAFPFAFIILSNGLSKLDSSLEPAAWSLGASRIRAFWTIAMPNVAPGLIGAFVISFLSSFDEAVLALFLTGLDKTLPVTIFGLVRSGVTPGVGAVAVMITLPVVLGVIGTLVISAKRGRSAASRA